MFLAHSSPPHIDHHRIRTRDGRGKVQWPNMSGIVQGGILLTSRRFAPFVPFPPFPTDARRSRPTRTGVPAGGSPREGLGRGPAAETGATGRSGWNGSV